MIWGRPLIVSAIAPYRFKFSQPWLTKRAITASHGHGGWAYRAIRSLTMSRFREFTVGDSPDELRRFVHRCNIFSFDSSLISSFINTRIWNARPVQTWEQLQTLLNRVFPSRLSPDHLFADFVSSRNRDFCSV